jgi:hypothetical protein
MAQALIFVAYLLYGCFVYVSPLTLHFIFYLTYPLIQAFQGQFTLPLAFQGVSKHSWQNLGNVIALITGIIAAGLYGNIGISK